MIVTPAIETDAGTAPFAVLIVDDSLVVRSVFSRIVESDGRYRVAAAVGTAAAALNFLARERVDVILLDLAMPGQHGLAALPDIVSAGQGARVLIVSSTSAEGAAASVQALALGASDTLVKPNAAMLAGQFAEQLRERLARLSEARMPVHRLPWRMTAGTPVRRDSPAIIAIGASTGGIHALGQMLKAIDEACGAPILITQHLPATFMPYFADQLAQLGRRPCLVAEDRMRIRAGHIYVAPGDGHLVCAAMTDGHCIRLDRRPSASGCMPSADPMFASVGDHFGAAALGIVLSGMGRDGAIGAARLAAAGGAIIAQDRASSVVWGMPGAVVDAGLAEAVLPPDAIGRAVCARFTAAP